MEVRDKEKAKQQSQGGDGTLLTHEKQQLFCSAYKLMIGIFLLPEFRIWPFTKKIALHNSCNAIFRVYMFPSDDLLKMTAMKHLFLRGCCAASGVSWLTKSTQCLKRSWCHPSCLTLWSMSSDVDVVSPQLALTFPLQPLSMSSSVHCPLYKVTLLQDRCAVPCGIPICLLHRFLYIPGISLNRNGDWISLHKDVFQIESAKTGH